MIRKICLYIFSLSIFLGPAFASRPIYLGARSTGTEAIYLPMVIRPQPPMPGIITFASNRDGDYDIYTMAPDGTQLINLTNNTSDDFQPAWSPDFTKIAFSSNRDGNYEIYTMNSDGSGVTRLTNNVASDYAPDWSPDGTRIIFSTFRNGNESKNENSEIYRMNVNGAKVTRLTRNSVNDFSPAWSPDGTKIAFCSERQSMGIYLMDINGSGETFLTTGCDPAWSPDGQKIAFYDSGTKLYMISPDGTNRTEISDQVWAEGPSWSPDGNYIIYMSWSVTMQNYDIHIISLDGTGEVDLTHNSAQDITPDWGALNAP